jgi:hypothetical protein
MTVVNKEKRDREFTTCCISAFVDVPSCVLLQIYGRPKDSSSWTKPSASKSFCPHVKLSVLLQCCFVVARSDVLQVFIFCFSIILLWLMRTFVQFCGRLAFVTYSVLIRWDSQHQPCLASCVFSWIDLCCRRVYTLSPTCLFSSWRFAVFSCCSLVKWIPRVQHTTLSSIAV